VIPRAFSWGLRSNEAVELTVLIALAVPVAGISGVGGTGGAGMGSDSDNGGGIGAAEPEELAVAMAYGILSQRSARCPHYVLFVSTKRSATTLLIRTTNTNTHANPPASVPLTERGLPAVNVTQNADIDVQQRATGRGIDIACSRHDDKLWWA